MFDIHVMHVYAKFTWNGRSRVCNCRVLSYFLQKRERTNQSQAEFEVADGRGHDDVPYRRQLANYSNGLGFAKLCGTRRYEDWSTDGLIFLRFDVISRDNAIFLFGFFGCKKIQRNFLVFFQISPSRWRDDWACDQNWLKWQYFISAVLETLKVRRATVFSMFATWATLFFRSSLPDK